MKAILKVFILALIITLCIFTLSACGDATVSGIEVVGAKTDFGYDEDFSVGDNFKVNLQFSDGKKEALSSADYTIDSSSFNKTETNTYQITVTYISDITMTTTYSVTVNQKNSFENTITMSTEPITYDGNNHSNVVSTTVSDADVTYSLEQFGTYTTAPISRKDVGEYPAYCKISKSGFETLILPYGLIITKATDNEWITTPTIIGWTYGQQTASEPTFASKYGNVVVGYYRASSSSPDYTPSKPDYTTKPVDVGDYKMRVQVLDNFNYNGLLIEVPFTIVKATDNAWITQPAITGWIYGQTGNEPIGASKYSTTFEYQFQGEGSDQPWVTIKPTDAGNYKMRASSVSSNYNEIDIKIIDFTIEKAETTGITAPTGIEVDVRTSLSSSDFGDDNSGWNWVDDGLWLEDNHIGSATIFDAMYTPNDSNYKTITLPVSVHVYGLFDTTGVSNPTTRSYDGTYDFYDVWGVPAEAMVTYSEDEVGEYTTTPITKKHVGAYTVHYKVTGANYRDYTSSFSWTITKATNAWSNYYNIQITDWDYTDTPETPYGPSTWGTPTFTYSTSENGTYSETLPVNGGRVHHDVGTYWLKGEVADIGDYDGLEAKVSFNIGKKTVAVPVSLNFEAVKGKRIDTMVFASHLITVAEGKLDISRAEGGTWSWETPDEIVEMRLEQGSYKQIFKAKFEPTNLDNYETLTNKDISVLVYGLIELPTLISKEYTGEQQTSISSGLHNDLGYSIDYPDFNTDSTFKDAGTHKVKLTKSNGWRWDSNANPEIPADAEFVMLDFEITQKAVDIPTGLTATVGQDLFDVLFTQTPEEGTWSWIGDCILTEAGVLSFDAKFEPASLNYSPHFSVKITVTISEPAVNLS